jgi:biotin transport system substrate-specific component
MARLASAETLAAPRASERVKNIALVVGASLFVALCAQLTVPLPFTPVPLTLQNFGVLLVGVTLGRKRAFAALTLYLLEGVAGLPVFNPAGLGGIAQLFGPTGGFLLAYPFVAATAGWIMESGQRTFLRALASAASAEFVLFIGGLSWLAVLTHSVRLAIQYGLYWFVFAEVIKVMVVAGLGSRFSRAQRVQP